MEEEFMNIELGNDWQGHLRELFKRSRKHSDDIVSRSGIDYINANHVTVSGTNRKFIATQHPLPHTVSHFWSMISEQKSSVIIMLNRCNESSFKKCERYWPEPENESMYFDDVDLKVTLVRVSDMEDYIIREMLLEDMQTHEERRVCQYQYITWPDQGQPRSPVSFLRFLADVRKSGGLARVDEPSIVHCSAGLGRSGTFILIDSILNMIESQKSTKDISIADTLITMRDHRNGLLQSAIQLRFSYLTILFGVEILKSDKYNSSNIAKTNGNSPTKNKTKQTFQIEQNLVEVMDRLDDHAAERLFKEFVRASTQLDKTADIPVDEQANKLLTSAINSLLVDKTQPPNPDSVLSRRREREIRNQRIAEKTLEIKNRMKVEDMRRHQMAFLKRSAMISGFAILVSSVAYMYLR